MIATIALVGCGRWGRLILRDLQLLDAGVIVVDPDGAARAVAVGTGASAVGDLSELPQVDAVVVATPASTHASVLKALVGLARPVFVEKPMATSVADARTIAAAWGDRLHVMEKWRYHPGIEAMARLAANHELGRTLGLRTTRVGWGHSHADVDVFWGLVPHDLSIAAEVLGAVPTPQACTADVRHGRAEAVWAHLGAHPWQVLEVGSTSPERRRRVELHAEGGIAVLDDAIQGLAVHRGEPGSTAFEVEHWAVSPEQPLLRELRGFLAHVTGTGPPPRATAADGLATVEVVARLRSLAGLGAL